MNNNFDTRKIMNASDAPSSESSDEYTVSSLPPDAQRPSRVINLSHVKQHLFDMLENVSRTTLQDIAQNDEDGQIDENADQANGETGEFEISELPPTLRSHFLLLKLARLRAALASWGLFRARTSVPLTPALRRRFLGRALTTFGIGLALLVLLFGNIPGLRAPFLGLLEPTSTPTPGANFTFSSMPIVINHFGPVPSYSSHSSPGPLPSTCPQISTLQYFTTPLDPPGLGASPLWLAGFTGPSATLDNLVPINAQVAHAPWPGGWYETVAVFIQKNYTGDITLRGSSQQNGASVWLSKNDPQILGNTLALNLADGSHFIANGQWEMTSITIAVPTAGCYALQASWSGNSWTRFFAAGR